MPVGERRLLEPAELWPQEERLCAKAAEGGLLDLRSRCQDEDDPVGGRDWSPQRRIRAQVLFQLLTGHGPELASQVVAVRLRGAQIVGRLNLGGWRLCCPLELNQCHLGHRLDLAESEVPNLNLRGSYLQSGLSARRLQVAHTLNLSTGFRCEGGAVLREAHIGGYLICTEAAFRLPDGIALNADGLAVDGNMFLRKVQCTGEMRLLGAHLGGLLDCSEAVFANPDGIALNAQRLAADGGMLLREVQCTGETGLNEAMIWGYLVCTQAVFSNPDGIALNADSLTVDVDMYLTKARCTGQVHMGGARIAGQLACTEAEFSNANRRAVNLEQATVAHAVYMDPASLQGGLNLTRARVGAWHDQQRTWPTTQSPPAELRLEGFVYDAIEGEGVSVEDRLRSWLPRKPYLPQPYEQLASVYRREGYEPAAQAVAIGKQRARRADHSCWWRRWPNQVWSPVLRWTIGYGYQPARALIPLAVLVLAGSLLFLLASQHPDPLHPVLRPAKPGAPDQPAFNSFRYTMDLLLPVVNFKQRDSFVAESWAAWAAFGFTFAGWLLAAVVVAGLSGVFKRN